MHLLVSLIAGLVVGVAARLMVPGREPSAWLVSILVGISGSFIGGYLGQLLNMYEPGRPGGLLMSVLGAVVLLLGHHALVGRRASS